jgi:hypothetical protein
LPGAGPRGIGEQHTQAAADRRQDPMADDHKHGNMDITEQEKTFEGFVKVSIWVAGVSIGILVFLAIFNS